MQISHVKILFISKTSRPFQGMSSRRLQRCLQCNNFSSSKTSSRRLQDVFKMSLQDVFKTSWKTKSFYAEDAIKKTSSKRLADVIKTS